MNKERFRTKSLGVDLCLVQYQFNWGSLILGSEVGMNEYKLRTKSPGVDLH